MTSLETLIQQRREAREKIPCHLLSTASDLASAPVNIGPITATYILLALNTEMALLEAAGVMLKGLLDLGALSPGWTMSQAIAEEAFTRAESICKEALK